MRESQRIVAQLQDFPVAMANSNHAFMARITAVARPAR
jgi:hypothetical protein